MSGSVGSGTSYLESKILGHSLGFAAWPMPGAVYVGLSTTQPSNTTPGTEPAGGAYARVLETFAAVGVTNVAQSVGTVEFPPATAAWGTVGWFELWDAAAGGNRLYQGTLVDPTTGVPVTRPIQTGDIFRLPAGSLKVTAI